MLKYCALLCWALAAPVMAQQIPEDKLHDTCLGFGMLSKGIVQLRFEGNTQEQVIQHVENIGAEKKIPDGPYKTFMMESVRVLTSEAFKLPAVSAPTDIEELSNRFGLATYNQCIDKLPQLLSPPATAPIIDVP